MATTFNVFSLGLFGTQLDPTEGDNKAENASALLGQTFGSTGNPLYASVKSFSPGSTAFGGGNSSVYDQDNTVSNDTFKINGGADQVADAYVIYNATITYANGTTANIKAKVIQDTAGNLYLVPDSSAGSDQTALEAGPIRSITFNTQEGTNNVGMTADRQAGNFKVPDGVVHGTSGNDSIGAGYTDAQGDAVDGWDGNNDRIEAGDGNDTVNAGAGDDTVYGGNGSDSINGGGGNDLLYGDAGNDTILGGGGSDTINGGTGNDSMSGGDDADTFVLENAFGSDTIVGGEGGIDFDTIDASGLSNAVTVTFSGNESGTLTFGANTANFSQIEQLILSNSNDSVNAYNDTVGVNIFGMGGNDSIRGGRGNDTIDGGTGNDTIDGDDGNDFITGGDGNDSLIGGAGNDSLYGGTGSDTLRGGTGNDYLSGGDDADRFEIASSDNTDTILGGEGGTDFDTLAFTSATSVTVTFTGSEAGSYSYQSGATGTFSQIEAIQTGAGNDSINAAASSSAQSLSSGAGDDTIRGGAGNDTIVGGLGNDLLTGGGGNDVFFYTAELGFLNPGDGHDTITDFNFGNTGALGDGDTTNNDFINLSGFYDSLSELRADQLDDGILNQSNATDTKGRATDYFNNSQFGAGSLTMSGATASSFTADNTGVVCFAAGTAIRPPRGDQLIDDLRVGDLVCTMDNGAKPIRWIARRSLTTADLAAAPKLLPVLIRRGVMGAERDLVVSPQHGLLSPHGDRLVRAKHLVNTCPGVRIAKGKRGITYIHLMFDAHQIIFAENMPSESFYPGPMALAMLQPAARAELLTLFPGFAAIMIRTDTAPAYGDTARLFQKQKTLLAAAAP